MRSQFFSDASGEDGAQLEVVDAAIATNLHIVWAAFLACWATAKLVFWRQRENDLAYRWGTIKCEEVQGASHRLFCVIWTWLIWPSVEKCGYCPDQNLFFFQQVETYRPQYYGHLQIDPDTKEWVKVYPSWKRAIKFVLTYTMVASLLFITGRATWAYHQWRELKLQEWVDGFNVAQLAEYEATLGLTDPHSTPPPPISLYVSSAAELQEHIQHWQWWIFMFVLPFGYGMAVPAINIVTMVPLPSPIDSFSFLQHIIIPSKVPFFANATENLVDLQPMGKPRNRVHIPKAYDRESVSLPVCGGVFVLDILRLFTSFVQPASVRLQLRIILG